MESIFEIIKKRSAPGIIIFDMQDNLQYFNEEAGNMVPSLREKSEKSTKKSGKRVPEEIQELCRRVRTPGKEPGGAGASANYGILPSEAGPPCSLRAFCIGQRSGGAEPTHVMVLLERVIERHQADYDKVQKEFNLTKRETDVLVHICSGLTNREISSALGIGEYTVKDHIKNIMRKMNAGSRSEIISLTVQ